MEAVVGARILSEVEEVSLEEILADLRSSVQQATGTTPTRYKQTHIVPLDAIQARHLQSTKSPTLSLSGRHLPLLYHLISHLLSSPHNYTILLVDVEGRFDPTRLSCEPSVLRHLYIHKPARSTVSSSHERLKAVIDEAQEFMLHGETANASRGREWWGTIVVGAAEGKTVGGDLMAAGWKGWLRVEREFVRGFGMGTGVGEARRRREERQRVVESVGWSAESPWGGFVFKD